MAPATRLATLLLLTLGCSGEDDGAQASAGDSVTPPAADAAGTAAGAEATDDGTGGRGGDGDGDGQAAEPADGAGTGDGADAPGGDGDGDDGAAPAPAGPDPLDFDAAAYRADLEAITGERTPGSSHWQAVQDLCASRLEALGFDVVQTDYGSGVNVIGTMVGERVPDEQVVVGAHYDHIEGCDGADDNASGVAGALELARLLTDAPRTRSLVVACWDEAETELVGSTAHATELAELGVAVRIAYSLDMIAYTDDEPGSQMMPIGFELAFPEQAQQVQDRDDRADFIAIVANEPAAAAMDRLGAATDAIALPRVSLLATRDAGSTLTNLLRSDHASFWRAELAAVLLTDTANFRNPAHHCNDGLQDSIDTLDLDFAGQVVRAAAEAIAAELDE